MDTSEGPSKRYKHRGAAGSTSGQPLSVSRFAFTMDANTGEIVKIERIDPSGAHHELMSEEKKTLVKSNGHARLEQLLEQAFEAGIACVLGDDDLQPSTKETEDESELRHILLKPLIQASAVARLMRPEVLDQAIVRTLIQHSLRESPKDSDTRKAPDKSRINPEAS